MTDTNTVTLIGRLVRDAEVKHTKDDKVMCCFFIALNRDRKDGETKITETHFFDVVFFGQRVEAIVSYLKKGEQVCIKGHLRQERWEKDGKNLSRVIIATESLQLLGRKANK